MSLREMILQKFKTRYLAGNNMPVNGGSIERFALEQGFKSSNASRRCRELAEDGLLEPSYEKTQDGRTETVWYKYMPNEREKLAYEYRYERKTEKSITE